MVPGRRFALRALGIGGVGCLLLVWCTLGGFCSSDSADTVVEPVQDTEDVAGDDGKADSPSVDLERRPLPRIPAGTLIGKTAPDGWSHLIMMVVPTVSKEDLKDAPRTASHYAQMFRFTLLARTEKEKDGYRLKTVARGFATTVRDKDTIVDPKHTFGARMGLFGARILGDNEKQIDDAVRQVARTPTMLVFDLPSVMRRGDRHVNMMLRHAILVDADTGKVSTFIWLLSKDGEGYALAEKELQQIPEGLHEQRELSFLREKFTLGIPTNDAIGMVRTPQGKGIAWTAGLEKPAAAKDFTKEQVLELEKQLRAVGK